MKHKIIIELVYDSKNGFRNKDGIIDYATHSDEVKIDNELKYLSKKDISAVFYKISHFFQLLCIRKFDDFLNEKTIKSHLKLKDKKNVIN